MQTDWDPLNIDQSIDSEILAFAKKREIKNILKSYVGFFDPFAEIIQNAMDAVDKKKENIQNVNYKKQLWIEINIDENSFHVTDNGIGFQEKQLTYFLAPNISYKSYGKTRGNKGVGATFLAYGFNYLRFHTKNDSFKAAGIIENGRNWVEDNDAIVYRPLIKAIDFDDKTLDTLDSGASFCLKFGGEFSRPKNLGWIKATTATQWKYLLLTKTPLGMIDPEEGNEIYFDITVINNGKEDVLRDVEALYVYPHKEIDYSVQLKEIINKQKEAVEKGNDVQKVLSKYQKKNGLFDFFSTDEIVNFVDDEELKELIKKYLMTAYGYFGYSTNIWDNLNDEIAKLRSGYRFIKGGLQIANNGMVQGDLITIPLTSNIGYQNQCHIVIHLSDADPDLGRKGFQPEVRLACEKISVSIVGQLKKWKKVLKSNSGTSKTSIKATQLYEWIKSQEEHEEKYALIIENKNFFRPTNEISIVSNPQSEQDVIVLFNQLIAGGVIRGILLLATSQSEQYDGVFRFITKDPIENYLYDEQNNPLGLDSATAKEVQKTKPCILEYKYSLDGLIADFENGEKIPSDIQLVIAWESGEAWKKDWEIKSLLCKDFANQRDFHGITHIMHNAGGSISLVILQDLIEFLNKLIDIEKVQKSRYEIE